MKYKVTITKQYEEYVEADTPEEAMELAEWEDTDPDYEIEEVTDAEYNL